MVLTAQTTQEGTTRLLVLLKYSSYAAALPIGDKLLFYKLQEYNLEYVPRHLTHSLGRECLLLPKAMYHHY